jgi:hypothetical protein
MLTSFYIIGSTILLLIALAKLHDAQAELARLQDESEQMTRDDAAYVHAVALSLAVLLAGLAMFNAPRPESKGSAK